MYKGSNTTVLHFERPAAGLAQANPLPDTCDVHLTVRVDIEADPKVFDRYAIRIPVLRVGEDELDAAGLDDAALRLWLRERR